MSKLINISDKLYEKLKAMKGENSFTITIESLLEKKSNKEAILSFAGLNCIDENEVKKLKKRWKKWRERYV